MSNETEVKFSILSHRKDVQDLLTRWAETLLSYARIHDESKMFNDVERECFLLYTPQLKKLTYGTQEYNDVLKKMGDGLQQHYRNNMHHPEHNENGINGMTLLSLVEMLADWIVASRGNVDFEKASERFGISQQLLQILRNTDDAFGFMYKGKKE